MHGFSTSVQCLTDESAVRALTPTMGAAIELGNLTAAAHALQHIAARCLQLNKR